MVLQKAGQQDGGDSNFASQRHVQIPHRGYRNRKQIHIRHHVEGGEGYGDCVALGSTCIVQIATVPGPRDAIVQHEQQGKGVEDRDHGNAKVDKIFGAFIQTEDSEEEEE